MKMIQKAAGVTKHQIRSGRLILPFPRVTAARATIQLRRLAQFAIAHGKDTLVAKDCSSARKPENKNAVTIN
jgi:hypothetical protein